jgi:iron complex transport system permease protein
MITGLGIGVKKAGNVRYAVVFAVLAALFCAVAVASINTGTINISIGEIVGILLHGKNTAGSMEAAVIWKLRLPRLLSAALLGGALSLSGFLLQTFFRNPIAGPFVLGISSGAKMVLAIVTITMSGWVTSIPMGVTVVTSFVGSLLSMVLVLFFARRIKSMSALLVVGIMISNICAAITDFMINFANEAQIVNLTHWSLGSFSGASWKDLSVAAPIVLVTLALTMCMAKPIGAYQLGEGYARSMGVNVRAFRVILVLLSGMLSACVTAFAGPIAFVGIAVPHITKLMLGTAKPVVVIPAVFMCGGIFCMACDLVARVALAPTELSIGTVTSLVGAPVVIWLMGHRAKEME